MDRNDVAAGEGILPLASSSSAESYRGVSFRSSKGVFSWESVEWRDTGRSESPSSGAASELLSAIVEEGLEVTATVTAMQPGSTQHGI